jgi:glycosyl-4,4'-diaponeurosporenoate acyltransferase
MSLLIPPQVLTSIAANALGCAALQLSIAAIAVRIPARHFARDHRLYRTHPAEIAFYRRVLRIRRWKSLLPDGTPWVGGAFRKKRLAARDPAYIRQLLLETRRGEAAHWLMLASFPIFFLWNPPWARTAIAVYALAANLPCILVQRYNRQAAERILASVAAKSVVRARMQ